MEERERGEEEMKAVFICWKCCEDSKDKPCKLTIHNSDRIEEFNEYPTICPMEGSINGKFTGEISKANWERVK